MEKSTNLTETIEDIAKSIKRHRELEITINATNEAIARSKVIYNDEPQLFWLTNRENDKGLSYSKDITGQTVGTEQGNRTTIEEDGKPIYKNTKLGGIIISYHDGIHRNTTPNGNVIDIEIFNRTNYKPSKIENEYATEIIARLSGDPNTYAYRQLSEILKKVLEIQEQINDETEQLKSATEVEADELLERIKGKEDEKKNYLEKTQQFIRSQAQLRYQAILDPIQEEIKRSNIFNGTLVINGGPGTGKTTALIQRIKFLTDNSISEFVKLSSKQKEVLFDRKKSWIFFSPNKLLSLYLTDNMVEEGLDANSQSVKVWPDYKKELIKQYRLVNVETKRPFLFYTKAEFSVLYKSDAMILKKYEDYYLQRQTQKLAKIIEIDVNKFQWKITGESIQRYILKQNKISNLKQLVSLYINLSENFDNETKNISNSYSALINKIVPIIQVEIQKDKARVNQLTELLKNWKNDTVDLDEDEEEDEEIDKEDFEELEDLSTFNFEKELFIKLKSLARKQAIKQFDKNTKLSKKDRQLLNILPELNAHKEYENLGQYAYFKKYFERISKGLSINLLREISIFYKAYRRIQLNSKSKNWNSTILEDLVKKDRNMRIHGDEQSLLLAFTNNLILKIFKVSNSQFNNLNHPYIIAYKEYNKSVIGVDEATDFSVIDLYAIHSFSNPQISSVTFSGDLMQRMTSSGIKSWSSLKKINSKFDIRDLLLSYRQSPTLLSIAKNIYKVSTGSLPNYVSFFQKDEQEPSPLILISQNEGEKIEWIAKRIHEIYLAYSNKIPSIAIFLPEENKLDDFATQLGNISILSDVGIYVKPCKNGEVLGDKNTVRVFSINVIKGLEFEAVFFHDFDRLLELKIESDLLMKYLYVGFSRSTFYLGVTVSQIFRGKLAFMNDFFDNSINNWRINN